MGDKGVTNLCTFSAPHRRHQKQCCQIGCQNKNTIIWFDICSCFVYDVQMNNVHLSSEDTYELLKQKLDALYKEYKAAYDDLRIQRSIGDDIDNDDLKPRYPNEVADVNQQVERISFLKGAIHNGLSKEVEKFAKDEIKARLSILERKLFALSELEPAWQVKKKVVDGVHELQERIPALEDEIRSVEMKYYAHPEHEKQNPSPEPPPEIPDDVLERFFQESRPTPEEEMGYEREAWEEEKTWYEISAESKDRALEELKDAKEDAAQMKQRLTNALKLEGQIEKLRKKYQTEVTKLLNIQKGSQKDLQSRIQWDDRFSRLTAKTNEEISSLEDYFSDIIPSNLWPDYIIGKPSQSADPEAAKQFQESLRDRLSFEEQQEFFSKQDRLKTVRKEQIKLHNDAENKIARLESAIVKNKKHEEFQKGKVAALREELNVTNGMRAAELKVALPRITVAGEDQIDKPANINVKVSGTQANTSVGKIVEASGSLSMGFTAGANAEVVKKAQENDAGLAETEAEQAKSEALTKSLRTLYAQHQVIPFTKGMKADPDSGTKHYVEAVDALNRQHELEELEGQTLEFILKDKDGHAKYMMAYRCGFWIGKDKVIEAEIISRLEPDNNTLLVYFPKSRTTGKISVYPRKSGDWEIATFKNEYDDWVNVAKTTPGVPPLAKINKSKDHVAFLKYYRLIQDRIEAIIAEAEQEMEAKKRASA